MFIRKKRNKSGVISILIITKFSGKSKLVKTIGSSSDENELKRLIKEVQYYLGTFGGQKILDFSTTNSLYKTAFRFAMLYLKKKRMMIMVMRFLFL